MSPMSAHDHGSSLGTLLITLGSACSARNDADQFRDASLEAEAAEIASILVEKSKAPLARVDRSAFRVHRIARKEFVERFAEPEVLNSGLEIATAISTDQGPRAITREDGIWLFVDPEVDPASGYRPQSSTKSPTCSSVPPGPGRPK